MYGGTSGGGGGGGGGKDMMEVSNSNLGSNQGYIRSAFLKKFCSEHR